MSFDIVITWVDWSNKNFINKLIEAGGRSEGCDSGEFIELKYVLRSLEKHKIDYRKIHIVHSDNHPPPKYLKETKRLSFVPHSALVTDTSHLPLIHRESIIAHLHKIPNITNLFFYLEDDQFIMNPKIFDAILTAYNDKQIYVNKLKMNKSYNATAATGLYNLAMVNSSLLFDNKNYNIVQQTHWIDFFDKSIINEIESLYPQHFLNTQSYQNQQKETYKEKYIIAVPCIFYNYLIYKKKFKTINSNELQIIEIHTNGYNKVTKSQKVDLLKKLDDSRNSWILNAQGNGISDEYPDCPIVHDIFYSFLEKEFPIKTEFENSQIEKFHTQNYEIKKFKLLTILLTILLSIIIVLGVKVSCKKKLLI